MQTTSYSKLVCDLLRDKPNKLTFSKQLHENITIATEIQSVFRKVPWQKSSKLSKDKKGAILNSERFEDEIWE